MHRRVIHTLYAVSAQLEHENTRVQPLKVWLKNGETRTWLVPAPIPVPGHRLSERACKMHHVQQHREALVQVDGIPLPLEVQLNMHRLMHQQE